MSQDSDKPAAAPYEYIVLKYRQYFGLTYKEFLDVPSEVFYTDLEMISLEAEAEKARINAIKNKSGK